MMNTESSSSIIPSSSSSTLAPTGRVAVPKHKEEDGPPAVVSSSSLLSVPAAAISAHVKQETAAVNAEAVGPEGNSEGHGARDQKDWEPGNWCWVLDAQDDVHTITMETAQVHVAVKEEAVTEEETETIKSQQENDDVISSAPHLASSLSSSPPITGIRLKKEEENEEKYNTLRRGDDVEVTEKEGLKSEHEDDTVDDDDDDDTNNHKIRHRTDQSVNSNRKSDHGCSGDNTIRNSSSIGIMHPDPFDDNNWMAGSWCWERPTTNSGTKRKASEHCRDSTLNTTNIAITHRRSFDRQRHDPGDDNWTTSCWCWAPPNTNSGISGVALAAAAVPSTRRRKTQKRSEQSRESKHSIPSKHHTNIGHHTKNNHTDIDEDDDDTDDIVECRGDQDDNHNDDDNDDGTDSDYDSVDDGDDDNDDDEPTFSEKRWNQMYGRLVKYKKKHKSTIANKNFDNQHDLHQWVRHQRYQFKRNVLSLHRVDRLESIGFTWNVYDTNWMKMYKRLVAYKKQFKTTSVPALYTTDPQLGEWVAAQRIRYNRKKSRLTVDRITQLDSIGFVWNILDAQWTEKYDRIVKYKEEYNTTCVPFRYPADPPLGRWVHNQRYNYNTNQSSLTADRIAQLESIGFVWNPFDAQWNEKYDRLIKYKKQNKTTHVPYSYPADPQLGRWVHNQRHDYQTNKSCLTADRITQLNSIGFVWKIRDK